MTVNVATDRCVGSGYCLRIAPELFDIGDDGIAFVVGQPTPELMEKALEAERSCPSMSISVDPD
jgi:ferredoxin